MIIQTKQQRENTLEALNVMWPSVPAKNVVERLKRWRDDADPEAAPDCGSIACFGGWCAWWPSFVSQGITVSMLGAPNFAGSVYGADTLLFGDRCIFNSRGDHGADAHFTGTDHELVTHRLQWLLENSKVSS